MEADEIKRLIEAGLDDAEARVQGDGSHFDAVVISPAFEGQTMVKEQQMVYATLGDRITDGTIHALSIRAYTPEEWREQQERKL